MYTEPALDAPDTFAGPRGGGGMWNYTYKHGDRPLEGYTIQRAAGRGGFGEVYYAVSDAGREVALKVITGFEQIELRGISQCMNLKSPHLVSIFDVRHNDQGRAFVIMEYVSGPNLRELLDESPAGLGPQKAAFFLREIGKGLSYLHDCGIVHRDLKPANIFFENGYAKIGDYGLSKAIAPTHHSGQTVTVGTVHYMAPEVGVGKYDRSIDIYALGALLFEMLTGVVPFVGASAGEILIKHLSHEADVTGIAEPFASAIKRAMAKDPADRFQTVQEMVEAVFGAEHVRNSVAEFSPQELSVIAGHVAARMARPAAGTGAAAVAAAGSSVTNPRGLGAAGKSWAAATGQQAGRWGAGPVGAVRRMADNLFAPLQDGAAAPDPAAPVASSDALCLRHRLVLGVLAAVVVSLAAQAFVGAREETAAWLFTVFGILGASTGVVMTARRWLTRPVSGGEWSDRFALAAAGAVSGIALSAVIWMESVEMRRDAGGTFIGILLALAIGNPRRWTNSDRAQRISFKDAFWTGVLAFIGAGLFGGNPALAIAIAGGAALVIQVLVPWDEQAALAAAEHSSQQVAPAGPNPAAADAPTVPGWGGTPAAAGAAHVSSPSMPVALPIYGEDPRAARRRARRNARQASRRNVPAWMLVIWACGLPLALATGTAMCVSAANSFRPEPGLMGVGVGMFLLAGFCFMRVWERSFTSWWSYLIVPALRLACTMIVVGCAITLGTSNFIRGDERMILVFFIVFCSVAWIMLWSMPVSWRHYGDAETWAPKPPAPPPPPVPPTPAAATPGVKATIEGVAAATGQAVQDAIRTTREALAGARWNVGAAAPPPPPRPIRPRVERDFLGGIAAFFGSFLVFVAFALAVLLAADLPGFLAVGLPDPAVHAELQDKIFAGWSNWPYLIRGLMLGGVLVLLAGGLAGVIFSRRRANGAHLIRGAVGVLGLFVALLPLFSVIGTSRLWETVVRRQEGLASNSELEAVFHRITGAGMGAFVILVVAMIVLFWPRRGTVQINRKGAIQ